MPFLLGYGIPIFGVFLTYKLTKGKNKKDNTWSGELALW